MKGKKLLAILLILAMMMTMLPVAALAKALEEGNASVELDISNGSIVIMENGYKQGTAEVTTTTVNYIIKQSSNTSTKNTITVTGGTPTITLNGVNIDVSTGYNEGDIPCAFAITGGDVTLVLGENSTNTLKSGYSAIRGIDVCCAGLWIKQGAALTICGSGQLDAYGGAALYSEGTTAIGNRGGGAGIGACGTDTSKDNKEYATVGSITIKGGTVHAKGATTTGYGGPGIGGGLNDSDITICGGEVTATSGRIADGASGIGNVYGYNGKKTIVICAGTVDAEGGSAGIGGGCYQPAYNIIISGGQVSAESTGSGAGIGGGGGDYNLATGGKITISGGSVTAQGGKYAAGIGGGGTSNPRDERYGGGGSGEIIISGGVVNATGGISAPGIGSGSRATLITATTDENVGRMERIHITGGNVTVTGGDGYSNGWALNGTCTGIGQGINAGAAAKWDYAAWTPKGVSGLPILKQEVLINQTGSVMVKRNGNVFADVTPVNGRINLWLAEGYYQIGSDTSFLVATDADKTTADTLKENLNKVKTNNIGSTDIAAIQNYEAIYNGLSETLRYYVDQTVSEGHTIAALKEKLKSEEISVTAELNSNDGTIESATVPVKYNQRFDLGVPIRDNYAFLGWYQGESMVTGADGKGERWPYLAKTTSLTAHWASEITGNGTEHDPYILKSAPNLVVLSKISNGVNTAEELALFGQSATKESLLSAYYKLDKDLTLTTEMGFYGITGFKGVFDGNEKTIMLNIDISEIVNQEGDPSDNSNTNNGKVCIGKKNGTDEDIYINMTGGLFNTTSGATIKNVQTAGTVKLLSKSPMSGVIVGTASNTQFEDCTNGADLTLGATFNTTWAGGIVGGVSSSDVNSFISFKNCINTGNITAGSFANSIGNSCAAGIISYANVATVTLENCNNTGKMTATRTSALAGRSTNAVGLFTCGANVKKLTMDNCKNSGNLSAEAGSGNTASGLCIVSPNTELTMTNCENSGAVTAMDGYASLLCGNSEGWSNMPASAVYTNCFHVMTGDGEYPGYSVGDASATVANGKTTLKVSVTSNAENYYIGDRYVSQNGTKVADIASSDFHKVYNDFSVNGNVLEDSFPFQNWNDAYTIAAAVDYTNLVKALQGDETAQNAVLGGRLSGLDAGSKAVALSDIYVKVAADFTLRDVSAIGLGTEKIPFAGKIDGQNHTVTYAISSEALSGTDTSNIGLIGYSNAAEMKNIAFSGNVRIGVDPTNGNNLYVGAAVANGSGAVVENCHSAVTFSASRTCTVKNATGGYLNIGGLVGNQSNLKVTDSSYEGNITATAPKFATVGGICAQFGGTIQNCTAKGDLEACLAFDAALPVFGEDACAGGIAGKLSGDSNIINCIAAGKVAANNTVPSDNTTVGGAYGFACAGGLVGYGNANMIVADSKALTSISATAGKGADFAKADGLTGKMTSGKNLNIAGTNWAVKTLGVEAVSDVNIIDTTALTDGIYGESKILCSGNLPSGITLVSEVASLDAATGTVSYTKAGTDTISLVYDGQIFYTSKEITVTPKALASGDVTVTGVNNVYVSDEAAAQSNIQVVYNEVALVKGTDYTVAQNREAHKFVVTFVGNYSGSAEVTYTVNEEALPVSVAAYSGTYDGAAHSIIVSAPEGAIITYGESAGNYSPAEVALVNAGTKIVYWKAILDGKEVTGSAVISITPATLTVTVDNKTMYVGDVLPKYSYTISGWQGNDSSFVTEPTVECSADGKIAGTYTITVSGANAGANYTIRYVDGILTVYTRNSSNSSSSSGGGFSGIYNYPVRVDSTNVKGAAVTLDKTNAVAGDKVTITVTPDRGKAVDEVVVTDTDGKAIIVTKTGDNKYTFTMPAGKVNIAVTTKTADYQNKVVLQIGNRNILENDATITNDVAPIIVDNRTMVPIRVITETLGGTADWNADTRTVTLNIDGKTLTMTIGQTISGFDAAPIIRNDRTYVPVRYVAEKLGANVEWIGESQQIVITK